MSRPHALQDSVYDSLSKRLSALTPGDAIPGERRLAIEHSCSRRTVRIVLRRLACNGRLSVVGRRFWIRPFHSKAINAVVAHLVDHAASSVVHQGISETLDGSGVRLILDMTPRHKWSEMNTEGIHAIAVFGHTGPPSRLLDHCQKTGTQLISLACNLQLECDTVSADFESMSRDLVSLILNRGHRRIAFIGSDPAHTTNPAFVARVDGFVSSMRSAGLDPLIHLLPHDFNSNPRVEKRFRSWMATYRPTCLYLSGPHYAVRMRTLLTKIGYKVPDEVSIAGFGATNRSETGSESPYTSLIEPWMDIGRSVGSRILAGLHSGIALPPTRTLVPGRIHDGKSIALRKSL
jgi:DNA-binding LacI/PurR family transcriptional regulator